MLLGIVLLYVGAVLVVNGIWLIGTAEAAEAPAGSAAQAGAVAVEARPTFIEGKEVAVINIFTGFVGVVVAVTYAVQGNAKGDLPTIQGAGYILLFAFTYLWVAFNQFLNSGSHGFGWYCLFVSITAIPAGIYTLIDGDGSGASVYLGLSWFAWSVLWFCFFLLLALERPIARITGYLTLAEGVITAWIFGFLLLEGKISF
jgi:putative amide transporter protein